MKNRLKEYFPLIRERREVLADIHENLQLADIFNRWRTEQKEDFLSELLKQRVKIIKVLPNDSVRIAMEGSLLLRGSAVAPVQANPR